MHIENVQFFAIQLHITPFTVHIQRLQDERAEVEKQREYFTKLREELQPGDGQKVKLL